MHLGAAFCRGACLALSQICQPALSAGDSRRGTLLSERCSVFSLYFGSDVTLMFKNLLKATQAFLAS